MSQQPLSGKREKFMGVEKNSCWAAWQKKPPETLAVNACMDRFVF